MSGILLALLASLVLTLADSGKKKLGQTTGIWFVIWVTVSCGALCSLVFLIADGFDFHLSWPALRILLACTALQIICEIAFIISVSSSDFSLAMPFSAFGPVFGTILAFFLFGEQPAPWALAGSAMVVAGSWFLLAPPPGTAVQMRRSRFSMLLSKGPLAMLVVCACFAGIANLQKLGADMTTPGRFVCLMILLDGLFFNFLMAFRREKVFDSLRNHLSLSIVTSVMWSFGLAMLYASFSYTLIAYAASSKQAGVLLSLPAGYYFFGEKMARRRLLPAIIILAGAVLVVLKA